MSSVCMGEQNNVINLQGKFVAIYILQILVLFYVKAPVQYISSVDHRPQERRYRLDSQLLTGLVPTAESPSSRVPEYQNPLLPEVVHVCLYIPLQ